MDELSSSFMDFGGRDSGDGPEGGHAEPKAQARPKAKAKAKSVAVKQVWASECRLLSHSKVTTIKR